MSNSGVSFQNLPPTGNNITTLSGNYILSDASEDIITDAAAGLFVTPFIASMYADASGQVGVLKQTTVQIVDIDKIFDVMLDEANAKKILKGFKVSDTDASGETNFDPSANVQVDMVGENAVEFQTALAAAIVDASDGTTLLSDWLKAETKVDVERLLSFDTLANLLEASVLKNFAIVLDSSDGASNMWELMDEETTEAAARRRAIFTQLTEDRVEAYAQTASTDGLDTSNERVAIMNFMPFLKGDKLAFVFDVVVGQYTANSGTAPSAGSLITRATGDYAAGQVGALSGTNGAGYIIGGQVESQFETGDIVIAKPTLRRVAVQIQLATGGGAFATSAATGSVAGGLVLSLA